MTYHIFSGTSHIPLAENICHLLGKDLGKISIETFPDQENGIRILEPVMGDDVFIIQSIAKKPNHYLMELFLIVDACKRAGAKNIIAVMPYFGYARQDRISKEGEPIAAKLVAKMLEAAGISAAVTSDLHSLQIEGFFETPLYHLSTFPLLIERMKKIPAKHPVIVSPDIGSNPIARKCAKQLKMDLAMVDKKRISEREVVVEALIGDVKGKEVILVDDICSTGKTLLAAAEICKKRGAKKIFAAFSHGLMDQIFFKQSLIDHFYMSDTIYFGEKVDQLTLVPSAQIFADQIKKMS